MGFPEQLGESSTLYGRGPHPNPLPGGEGTRKNSLSPRERAGVRALPVGHSIGKGSSVKPTIHRHVLAVLAGVLTLAAPAGADGPAPSAHDPEARRLFDEVIAAYKALPAYADRGEFATSVVIDGTLQKRATPFHLEFVR